METVLYRQIFEAYSLDKSKLPVAILAWGSSEENGSRRAIRRNNVVVVREIIRRQQQGRCDMILEGKLQ